MVFASRMTQEFITPGHVLELERWVGRACLDALTQFEIAEEVRTIGHISIYSDLKCTAVAASP